jgi:cytochrome c556
MTDAARERIYLAIIAVLLFVIAVMAYKFIIAGSTKTAADGRPAIILEPGERALILREMREFVAVLQRIDDALSRGDMQDVAKASRTLGASKAHDVPAVMMGKLPLEFKALALSVHSDFDTIAMDAEWTGLPKRTLAQLSEVMKKCTACHESYRLTDATLN